MNEVQSYEHNDSSKIFGDVQNSGAQRYAGKYMYLHLGLLDFSIITSKDLKKLLEEDTQHFSTS